MNCVVCEEKATTIDTRTNAYFTTYRTYECKRCDIRFKTTEKIIFESVPKKVRNTFLDTGKRKPL